MNCAALIPGRGRLRLTESREPRAIERFNPIAFGAFIIGIPWLDFPCG